MMYVPVAQWPCDGLGRVQSLMYNSTHSNITCWNIISVHSFVGDNFLHRAVYAVASTQYKLDVFISNVTIG